MNTGSITAIWRALGGGPLHYHRGRAFWRKGDGWNIALDEEKGVWYDFAANEGGGLIDLVQRARGCDTAAAAAWLCGFTGIPQESHTPEERRSFARHRREVEKEAQLCARWALGLRMHLERAKRESFIGGKWFLWQRACRRLFLLESSDAITLQTWCNQARERDLKRWQALVRDGERDVLFSEKLCALIVDWLTEAQCRQGKAA
ncbi:hypothetical protein [uncultured Paludibaculum sp.]|uniref:hypothetical protein n=1 Tax=uncultured Paludibaculum sp. TaxID=1765020 RepID=UPI002AAB0A6C|nr:hypothetical protein [uncultured Paludibaculum sp.]